MDLDAMKRHVDALKKWKAEVEQLFEPATLDRLLALAHGSTEAGEDDTKAIAELGEHVTGLQKSVDDLPDAIKASIDAAVAEAMKPYALLADPATIDLLNWLAANREALDVLVSLGDDATGGGSVGTGNGGSGNGGSGGPSTTMGSAGGTGTAGGSSSGGGTSAGTDGAASGQASQGAAAGQPAA